MGKYELRSRKRPMKSDEDEKDICAKNVKSEKSTESFTTKIWNLNDYCLDNIFDYLSYEDVLSTSQVCLRFEDRARAAFKRKKHNVRIFSIKANESKQLLRHIGPALLKLEIFFCEDVAKNQRTIDIITKYCKDNLTDITLHCLTKRNKLRKPFSHVNRLTLSFCDLVGRFKFTKWFPNLTSLTYNYTKNLKKFMKQNIPMMHTLNINYVTTQTETTAMLLANPQIKSLSLNFVSQGSVMIQRNLFGAIDKALPELETLNLIVDRVRNVEIEYLPLYFKHLKALRIENYSEYPNSSLIDHLAISYERLERLQLRFSDTSGDSQSYRCITKYKHLRELQIMPVQRSLGVDAILMLIHQLPLLQRIEQTADFANILPWRADEVENFIRNSKQLTELAFIFVYEAKSKFNRTVTFMNTQFAGSTWIVNTKERLAPKIFDTDGVDGHVQRQLVISIIENSAR